ncbi:MAG: HEAT repeat domain-containing protein [Candidatus Odinarchaeota archaeon]
MPADRNDSDKFDKLLQVIEKASSATARVEALIELRLLDDNHFSQRVMETLKSALSDSEGNVRSETVMTLAFLFKDEIIPLLLSSCNDADPRVRSSVIAAMSYIGVYDDTIKHFLSSCLLDTSDDIRDRAARALGRLGAMEMVDDLCDMALEDPSNLVRVGAISSLGMLDYHNPTLDDELKKLLDLPETHPQVIYAILDYLHQFTLVE